MQPPCSICEISSQQGFDAGRCRLDCRMGEASGPFVFHGRRDRSYIPIRVTEVATGEISDVRFVFDTGAEATVIPRHLLPKRAFVANGSPWPLTFWARGAGVFGSKHRASLLITCRGSALPLGEVELLVVSAESCAQDYAILGVDAMKQVVAVRDREVLSLWRSHNSLFKCQKNGNAVQSVSVD